MTGIETLSASEDGRGAGRQLGPWSTGLLYYLATTAVVMLGVSLGVEFVRKARITGQVYQSWLPAVANWDGQWYARIAAEGYDFRPGTPSSVAFFPSYPLAARGISAALGVDTITGLLVVSNTAALLGFVVMGYYVRGRWPAGRGPGEYALLALGLLPVTLFFRMAYSESLFFLVTISALLAMSRGWPLPTVAVLIGLATATRPVGVALIPPFLFHLARSSPGLRQFLTRSVTLIPLACWGILAYMLYQHLAFGDAFAFAKTQADWVERPSTWGQRAVPLLTLEPLRAAVGRARAGNPLWEPAWVNLGMLLFATALAAIGYRSRVLNEVETLTFIGLILIPYMSIGYDNGLRSMGRFCSVAPPLYLVLGTFLRRLPSPLIALTAGISGILLGGYSALFAAWYPFY